MIAFEKIELKNVLGYGNTWTSFPFKSGIIRIEGKNGHGKSAIIDAFYFALFGKAYRDVVLGLLPNSINKKEMEVHLYFSTEAGSFRIERGLKPNIFKIFKNDVIIDVPSSSKSYQQILEDDILHMTPNIAEQILIKSLTKDISFLTLKKPDKRAIIENILDIKIFTAMNKNCKDKVDVLTKSIAFTVKDQDNNAILIEQEKASLLKLKKHNEEIEADSKVRIDSIDKNIQMLLDENTDILEQLKKVQIAKNKHKTVVPENETLLEQISVISTSITENESTLASIQKNIATMEQLCSDCPKVDQIVSQYRPNDIKEQIEKLKTKRCELKSQQEEVASIVTKCEKYIARGSVLESTLQFNYETIEKLERSKSEIKGTIEIDTSTLRNLIDKKKELVESLEQQNKEKVHYQFIRSMLSDDAIKAFVIRKYLPVINKLLVYYLNKMNSEIIFNFDEEFEEVMLSRHKESFTYHSCSEGQKRRIDLAVLFTFVEFCKSKYPLATSNLMILDEVTAGLDVDGENDMFGILREINNKENKCILVISHSTGISSEYVDKSYEVKIVKKFSELKEK
jgi:DNA repair exonuclease SbcCD ATPase subunit